MCVYLISEVNDLHKFVSVALHTAAGEGDLSSDRLSHLKVVGSGFGPLIYDLKENSSFELFRQKCEAVWKAVDLTPKLPKLLVHNCIYVYIRKCYISKVVYITLYLKGVIEEGGLEVFP